MKLKKEIKIDETNIDLETVVNNCVYSTDEICIGKWTNGKPLYRKVIISQSPSTANQYITIATLGNNVIDNLITFNPLIEVNYSGTIVYYNNNIDEDDNIHKFWAALHKRTGNIQVNVGTQLKNQPMTIILEYTKTTD